MFHITRKGDYAIRAMICLARQPAGKIALVREVSAEVDVPPALLAKVFQNFSKIGLVQSFRGKGGGFQLGRDAKNISLLEVIEAVDGPVSINRCIVARGICGRESFCSAHPVWRKIQQRIRNDLQRVSLRQLAKQEISAIESNRKGVMTRQGER